MVVVKQLLVRVPDELYVRLVARAEREGRPATAIVAELLEAGVRDESGDARVELRIRARRLGVLASTPAPAFDLDTRPPMVAAMGGVGPVIDEIIADGR
jgi:plasmid stability protein